MKEFLIKYITILGGLVGIVIFIIAALEWGFLEGIIVALIIAVPAMLYPVIQKPPVVGTYDVKGKNPINDEPYSGKLQIKKQGELLSGTWEFGRKKNGDAPEPSYGTGLRVGNALAFTFKLKDVEKGTEKGTEEVTKEVTRPGVSLYKIRGNHMSGKWAVEGETNAGFEECSKGRA